MPDATVHGAQPDAPVNSYQVKTRPRFVVVLVSVVLLLQVASLATIGVTLHESERRSDEIAALASKVDETARSRSDEIAALASKVEIAALSSKVDETARSISADVEAQIRLDRPTVGPISSVRPSNKSRPHVIMAMDIDYPPYAYTRETHPGPPFSDTHALDEVVGVGADMIKALGEHCGFDVTITQAHWSDCWGAGEIGAGLREGWYHGCMTFTHAAGVRNRYLDFTESWAEPNKPAGLITRLDSNRVPHIKGKDDLAGRTIVDVRPHPHPHPHPTHSTPIPTPAPLSPSDVSSSVCSPQQPPSSPYQVTGWAPTADTLFFVKNECTNETYNSTFKIIQGKDVDLNGSYTNVADAYAPGVGQKKGRGANDQALLAVLEGKADAMWIYGDQADNYRCPPGEKREGWSCDLWNMFGKDFAYIQVGMYQWMHNGTTFAFSKKGSGLNDLLNPCIESFVLTQTFYDTCKIDHAGHTQLQTCLPNEYIKDDKEYVKPEDQKNNMTFVFNHPWRFPTIDMANASRNCSTGYCNCEE